MKKERHEIGILQSGGLVAYPTESFYALGVDATNAKAVQRLFRAKGRKKGKSIALIAANLAQVRKFFYMTAAELRLAKKFWPALGSDPSAMSSGPKGARARRGALTILLQPKSPTTPASGHPSLEKEGTRSSPHRILIGVRVPAHAQARALALKAGVPITATSANRSGQPPTKSAAKVKRDFPGILVLPGRCGRQRRPSTVVMLENRSIITLRQGSVHV